jgi:hypothetical protein
MVGKAGLITVIGFSIILGYISLNMARVAKNATGVMASYTDATVSHNLATTGINVGLARFYSDTTWVPKDTTQILNGPRFYGSIRIKTANVTISGANYVRLTSISTYTSPTTPVAETLHDTVEVLFDKNRKQTFSIFAWMTNSEGGVNWTTQDTVWGLVHSNGTIYVNGKPVFMEKLTTSKSFNKNPGTSPNFAIFKKSYEKGVATKDLPNDLNEINTAASAAVPPWGKKYASDIWVTLLPGTGANGDGKAVVCSTGFTTGVIETVSLSNPLFNGVIGGTGDVHVKGTVDGKLTLSALSQDIIVEDEVLYERNPRVTTSDDLLGLVADQKVRVADNAANRGGVEIDACVFARAQGFTADNYNNTSPVHANPLFGELKVLGSIVQNTRGAVGTVSGMALATGFSKRYRFDDRLADKTFRPPFFPGYFTKTYAITNWWESFRVPNINQ